MYLLAAPYSRENGAAPSYVTHSSSFSKVTCKDNNKNCQVPTTQGIQMNVDMMTLPCLQDIAPDGMTCKQVSESWTPVFHDSTSATANLTDGFKCGCMSDKVQSGLCSPIFVNSEVCVLLPLSACRYFILSRPNFCYLFSIVHRGSVLDHIQSWRPQPALLVESVVTPILSLVRSGSSLTTMFLLSRRLLGVCTIPTTRFL